MRKKVDCIVVGQGLAGTVLGHQLERHGKSFVIFDTENPTASSKAAAGLINPITGKKMVKSWKIDELLPVALDFYSEISDLLNIPLVYPNVVFRVLKNQAEENDWLLKTQLPDFENYTDSATTLPIPQQLHHLTQFGIIKEAYRIDLQSFLEISKEIWSPSHILVNAAFQYDELQIFPNSVQYQDITADFVLFSEGATWNKNPYFSYLPILPNKGEALLTEPHCISIENIIKNTTLSVPLTDKIHWLGGTSQNRYEDELPNLQTLEAIQSEWQELLQQPIKIQKHLVGIRPTTPDRRPMLGKHPKHDNLYIFNGLGTKGTLLAPYFSVHLIQHIFEQTPLMEDVDIQRFEKKYWGMVR